MNDLVRLALAYFLILPLIGLVVAIVMVLALPRPRDRGRIIEIALRQYLLFCIALAFLCNFVVHTFFGHLAAPLIGWEPSPFEIEVGMASLGFGLVGSYALRRDAAVRFAAVLGPAAFLWGAGVGHIIQIVQEGNFSPGNAGFVLYLDILLPIVGFVLVALSRRHPVRTDAPADAEAA
ncbi:DUF6790 family protein [Pseudonocardia sp.]|uniref:DUF6790 family protein n=1 Tax=Pseudonocardia sp. TaxID=60912 RepID=UPI003D14D51C